MLPRDVVERQPRQHPVEGALGERRGGVDLRAGGGCFRPPQEGPERGGRMTRGLGLASDTDGASVVADKNGVNTSGAAAKVMNFDRLGKRGRPKRRGGCC